MNLKLKYLLKITIVVNYSPLKGARMRLSFVQFPGCPDNTCELLSEVDTNAGNMPECTPLYH